MSSRKSSQDSGAAGQASGGVAGQASGGVAGQASGAASGQASSGGTAGQASREAVEFASNPLAALREGRLTRRFVQLFLGLWLYGASMALMIRANLGLDPWDVFHQGLMEHTPLSFGTIVIIISGVVLLAWIPLRQVPGIGTLCNAVVIGIAVDATLLVLPAPESMVVRVLLMVSAIVLNAVAGGAYIGARLGPGPRDGLMTGLVRRTGQSVRLVRTVIEITVLAIGWLLGGTVGLGTVLYAVSIGPLVHIFLPRFTVPAVTQEDAKPEAATSPVAASGDVSSGGAGEEGRCR